MGDLCILSTWRLFHYGTGGGRNATISKTESPRQVDEPRKDNEEFILKWKFAFHYECVGENGRIEVCYKTAKVQIITAMHLESDTAPTEISQRSLDIGFSGHRFIMFFSDNIYPAN